MTHIPEKSAIPFFRSPLFQLRFLSPQCHLVAKAVQLFVVFARHRPLLPRRASRLFLLSHVSSLLITSRENRSAFAADHQRERKFGQRRMAFFSRSLSLVVAAFLQLVAEKAVCLLQQTQKQRSMLSRENENRLERRGRLEISRGVRRRGEGERRREGTNPLEEEKERRSYCVRFASCVVAQFAVEMAFVAVVGRVGLETRRRRESKNGETFLFISFRILHIAAAQRKFHL